METHLPLKNKKETKPTKKKKRKGGKKRKQKPVLLRIYTHLDWAKPMMGVKTSLFIHLLWPQNWKQVILMVVAVLSPNYLSQALSRRKHVLTACFLTFPHSDQDSNHYPTNQPQPLIWYMTHWSSSKLPSLSCVVYPKREGWVLPPVTNRGWRVMKCPNWKDECAQPKPFNLHI